MRFVRSWPRRSRRRSRRGHHRPTPHAGPIDPAVAETSEPEPASTNIDPGFWAAAARNLTRSELPHRRCGCSSQRPAGFVFHESHSTGKRIPIAGIKPRRCARNRAVQPRVAASSSIRSNRLRHCGRPASCLPSSSPSAAISDSRCGVQRRRRRVGLDGSRRTLRRDAAVRAQHHRPCCGAMGTSGGDGCRYEAAGECAVSRCGAMAAQAGGTDYVRLIRKCQPFRRKRCLRHRRLGRANTLQGRRPSLAARCRGRASLQSDCR